VAPETPKPDRPPKRASQFSSSHSAGTISVTDQEVAQSPVFTGDKIVNAEKACLSLAAKQLTDHMEKCRIQQILYTEGIAKKNLPVGTGACVRYSVTDASSFPVRDVLRCARPMANHWSIIQLGRLC
jgi:hypothetical protein